jgi:DNA (cytosine-5)-methyltransferase 1
VTGSGGGGISMYHWEENRALTKREQARFQTFPDDFVFYGGRGSVRRQVGMAVPPQGAKIIFDAILKTFANVNYEAVLK